MKSAGISFSVLTASPGGAVETSAPAAAGSREDRRASPHRFRHFVELDGLRGIATLAVFFHHVCFTSIPASGWTPWIAHLRTLSIGGNSGVDLFFVLSGFLITSLLLEARNRPAYYHDFYWKRALRILPLYALCLLGVLLFLPGSGGYVLLSALFVSNFALFFHVVSAGPFWTLAIEEQFYLVWPAVLRGRSIARLRRWALVLALSSVALRLAAAAIGHRTYYYTFFRCDGLAAGAYIAFWFHERGVDPASRVREAGVQAALLVTGIVFCALWLLHPATLRADAFVAALSQTGVTLLCAGCITFALTHAGEGKLAILRSPVLTFFGLISYALYMVHLYVLAVFDHLRGPLAAGDTGAYLVRFATILATTIVLCLVSRYVIELPANSLRRFVLSDRSGRKG